MKVLQQLIEHFWARGVLNQDQAHYLVENGFVRPGDLPDYTPRDRPEDDDDTEIEEPAAPLPPPDPLDVVQEELTDTSPGRGKGGKAPKASEYSLADLRSDLQALLAARQPWFGALAEAAGRRGPSAKGAAVSLRQLGDSLFRQALERSIQARPGLAGDLWECLTDEPFHALASRTDIRGRVARDFGRLLRCEQPGQWGKSGWLLKAPEVQDVMNLLALRRPFLSMLADLHSGNWSLLTRSLQRPARYGPAWRSLGYSIVLLHHARVAGGRRPVPGFPFAVIIDGATWKESWTTAMALDLAAVTPLFVSVFGARTNLNELQLGAGAPFLDLNMTCPYEWKI